MILVFKIDIEVKLKYILSPSKKLNQAFYEEKLKYLVE